jgi:hypothetical protein
MNFNFGEVLSRAWQIVWKHKVLWVFGIFAGCSRGGGGGGGSGIETGTQQPFPELQRFFEQIGQWIDNNAWIVAVFVILILVLVVVSIFLGTIGRIGLIKGTYRAEQGEERLIFGELFSESMPYFWRVFGLSLLIILTLLIVFMILFIPLGLFAALTAGIGLICLLPLICLLIPLAWALTVVIEQANIAIVLEDLGIGDGLRRGWEVVRANVGTMILMALILFIGSAVVGIVLAIPLIITVVPLAIGLAGAGEGMQPALWFWIVGACGAVYLPILLLLNGILTAFMQSTWTLTYMRLTKPQDNAPIVLEANA